ncbi:hypothetical protein [Amycolatopsis sp. NPDC004378]
MDAQTEDRVVDALWERHRVLITLIDRFDDQMYEFRAFKLQVQAESMITALHRLHVSVGLVADFLGRDLADLRRRAT